MEFTGRRHLLNLKRAGPWRPLVFAKSIYGLRTFPIHSYIPEMYFLSIFVRWHAARVGPINLNCYGLSPIFLWSAVNDFVGVRRYVILYCAKDFHYLCWNQ